MSDLAAIRVPVLILVGDGDVPHVQIVARSLAYYLPDARLAVVPGGGHLVNLIQPDRYNSTIMDFLGKIARPPQ